MRANYGMRKRQRGAVAVIMGIAALALFAFMGIAVDLAYLFAEDRVDERGRCGLAVRRERAE